MAVGLAVGAAAAAAGTWLLDPDRGAGRRARLQAQGRRLAERAQEQLAARGSRLRGAADSGTPKLLPAHASPGAIGEIASKAASTAAAAGERLNADAREAASTAAAATERLNADAREAVAAGTVAAEGQDAERGDWHRDLEA